PHRPGPESAADWNVHHAQDVLVLTRSLPHSMPMPARTLAAPGPETRFVRMLMLARVRQKQTRNLAVRYPKTGLTPRSIPHHPLPTLALNSAGPEPKTHFARRLTLARVRQKRTRNLA